MAATMPDDIPEDKWRAVLMWKSLLEYPDVVEIFKMSSELKTHAPSESIWLEMLRSKIQESAQFDDVPSFETLSRLLRDVQPKYWKKIDPYKHATVSKTLS